MNVLRALSTVTQESAGQASALPFLAYSDSEVFELERDRIFQKDWLSLCPAAQLAEPGDYLAVEIAGEPVVVMRSKDGRLRALSNVCRHRGTLLLDQGFGNVDRFLCPYHAWAYDDTGRLRSVPYPGDIEIVKEDHGLGRFRLEEWAGVVFICLDESTPPLAERLRGLDEFVGHYELDRFTQTTPRAEPRSWKTNWKLALENGMESYHLFKVHRETLEPIAPTANAFYLAGSAPWSLTAGTYSFPATADGTEPAGVSDFQLQNYVLVSIPPTFVGILTPSSWGWISVLPRGPEESRIVSGSLYPASQASSGSQSGGQFDAFMEEDRVICERNQLAMKTRRARGGRMIQLERILVDFHQYLGSRLFDQPPDELWVAPECPLGPREVAR